MSFYRVLDLNSVIHDPVSGRILQPVDHGYQSTAVHQANIVANFEGLTTGNGFISTNEAIVQEQSLLAPVLRLKNSRLNSQIDY